MGQIIMIVKNVRISTRSISVLCERNEAYRLVNRVETYLFYGRDRRRVLVGCTY